MVIWLIGHDLESGKASVQIGLAQDPPVSNSLQGVTDCGKIQSLPVLTDLLEDALSTGLAFQLTENPQSGDPLAG